jgi:hypothetical protein
MSLRSRLVMQSVVPSAHLFQARFASTTTGAGCLASTSVLRAPTGGKGDDSNFNSMYKPVEWHKDPEDVTNESDLPSAARLVKKDLPSAEEAFKLAESWGTVKPNDDD